MTKAIPLSGSFTYVRGEVLRPTTAKLAATQPIFFVDVQGLPTAMRYHIVGVDTADGTNYTNTHVRGIVSTDWYADAQGLAIDLDNPPGAVVELLLQHGAPPERVRVDSLIVAPVASRAAFDGAGGNTWYYDAAEQVLRVKIRHTNAAADLFVEYSSEDTTPPTAPANVSTTVNGNAAVTLNWAPANDTAGVHRYVVLRNGDEYAAVAGRTASFIDDNVQAGATYVYSVVAVDPSGNRSLPSNSVSIAVPVDAVQLFFPDIRR